MSTDINNEVYGLLARESTDSSLRTRVYGLNAVYGLMKLTGSKSTDSLTH